MLPALWPSLGPEQIKPGDEAIATRRTILAGCGLCLAAILLVAVSDILLKMSFTSSTFLAVLSACWCAQLSFVSLILAPIGLGAGGMGAKHSRKMPRQGRVTPRLGRVSKASSFTSVPDPGSHFLSWQVAEWFNAE